MMAGLKDTLTSAADNDWGPSRCTWWLSGSCSGKAGTNREQRRRPGRKQSWQPLASAKKKKEKSIRCQRRNVVNLSPAKRQWDLLGVVAQRVLRPQHLPGHQGVEDGRPGQRQAEVKAEEPPVLHRLIELSGYSRRHRDCRFPTVNKAHLITSTFHKEFLLNLPFNSVLL